MNGSRLSAHGNQVGRFNNVSELSSASTSFSLSLSLSFSFIDAYLKIVGTRKADDLLLPVGRLVTVVADRGLARADPLVVARLQPFGKRAKLVESLEGLVVGERRC